MCYQCRQAEIPSAEKRTVMQQIVIDALIGGIVVPLFVAIALVGAIRFGLADPIGRSLAAGAIAVGLLAGFAAMESWPPFPPVSASQKLVYLVSFGVVLGTLLDFIGNPAAFRRISILLWPTIVVGWIGWRQIAALDAAAIVSLALIDLAGIVVLWRLYDEPGPAPNAPVAIISASIGAAIVALIGHFGDRPRLLRGGCGEIIFRHREGLRGRSLIGQKVHVYSRPIAPKMPLLRAMNRPLRHLPHAHCF